MTRSTLIRVAGLLREPVRPLQRTREPERLYDVWGERMGGPTPEKKANGNLVNYELFKDHWIPGGFPAVGVQYKGRGLEWFPAEVPNAFEWMAHKRRHNPTKVGFKDTGSKDADAGEFRADQRTLRLEDNRFYWLGVSGISDRRLNDARAWNVNGKPATVAGKITGNQIGVYSEGVRQVSVWLAPGTIDFGKPVTVRVNYNVRWNNLPVKPSLGTLLEDFYGRGDHQRLYLARIDVKA